MTKERKLPKIAVKELQIIYVPFWPAASMCFHIQALVLIIFVVLKAGTAICSDTAEEQRMRDGRNRRSSQGLMKQT